MAPEPLLPGARIGIVGSGQLGRMTVLAAARLGYPCHVLAAARDDPAAQVTAWTTVAALDDDDALDAFAASVDVVTFEFENLPLASMERLAARVPVRPAPAVLAVCQDRLDEKACLERIGAPVAPWARVRDTREAAAALARLGAPAILKTARHGYDGKGQARLDPGADAVAAFAALGGVPCVLERFVDFRCELSVVTARDLHGRQTPFPPVLNRHEHHILAETLAPAPIAPALAERATDVAREIADALDLVGVLAVEMFLTRDDRILVNELAPRPHNSGHWTIEACAVSQFDQLVRAVCGLKLADPTPCRPARMVNLIGTEIARAPELLADPTAHVHVYGKSEARRGRKMGHVTWLLPEPPRDLD